MYTGFSEMIGEIGIEKAADYAKSLGYTSVELYEEVLPGRKYAIPDVASARAVKAVLEERGLSVACYSVYADIWQSEGTVNALMNLVEIAGELGSPFFHHTLLPGTVPSYEEGIRAAVDAAARIADYAATFGLTCIYEDQGQYVNGVEGFQGFWSEMKKRCGNVGICGDLGNILFVNETPEAFLKAYIKDICHVHVKDYLWKKGPVSPGRYWNRARGDSWLRDTMVGSGVVDFEACMKILKEAGYEGAFALELNHPEPYEAGVGQAIEYLKRYW